mmetsp:Transcript_20998/g.39403  ORF Transcript_20998/g.39403 Transcript_20998/m.39403 type:complete len:201 (+) Transcript_20998:193-795(+)
MTNGASAPAPPGGLIRPYELDRLDAVRGACVLLNGGLIYAQERVGFPLVLDGRGNGRQPLLPPVLRPFDTRLELLVLGLDDGSVREVRRCVLVADIHERLWRESPQLLERRVHLGRRPCVEVAAARDKHGIPRECRPCALFVPTGAIERHVPGGVTGRVDNSNVDRGPDAERVPLFYFFRRPWDIVIGAANDFHAFTRVL